MLVVRLCLALLPLLTHLEVTSGQQTCLDHIADIYTMESQVVDVSVRRTYILCPRRIFEIGKLDFNMDLEGFQVQPPLPIRPNMSIKCGDTGSRENLCWIAEGDLQMDATSFRGITDETVENVSIEGLVFIGARKFSLWAAKPGDITFRDCEWRDFTTSVVPIMLDWFDGSDSQLAVSFEDCSFHNNRYFGFGSHTSLIYGNSAQNNITIRRTVFDNNDMVWNNTLAESNSFIIETLGPLTVERTCFTNNRIGVSNVAVFGNGMTDSQVYIFNSTGNLCGFGSVFQNVQQFDLFKPLCVNALQTRCNAQFTANPTLRPTNFPTTMQSPAPSTSEPTVTASATPTVTPTTAPSPMPSVPGDTKAPTQTPSETPPTTPPTAPLANATTTTTSPNSFVFPTETPVDETPDGATTSSGFLSIMSLFFGSMSMML